MKKVFLSAIMMITFSGVSRANDNVMDFAERDCDQEGINARDCAYELTNIDWSEAEQIGHCVTEKCYAETATSGGTGNSGGGTKLIKNPNKK